MSRAIAIAVNQQNPLKAATESARNFGKLLADVMYGTPKRTELTCALAFTLMCISAALNMASQSVAHVCPI